jgi:hypothetical protein
MGTDIHMFVEKENKSGYWEGLLGPNPQIQNELMYAKWARDRGEEDKAKEHEKRSAEIASGEYLKTVKHPYELTWYAPQVFEGWLYDNRNYDVFAILADVRNGHGFAGVETGEGFNSISSGRGVPDDVSEDVEEKLGYDSHYHSVTYVTLRELVDYDWNQTTTHYGVVSESEFRVWQEKGKPSSWSGGVSGGMVVHLTNEEMDALINGEYTREEGKTYYTRVSWEETYAESASDFYPRCVEELKKLSDRTDLSDVRIVMGFDS